MLIDFESFASMVPHLVERHFIKSRFLDQIPDDKDKSKQEKEEERNDRAEETMRRLFREFSNKKLCRPAAERPDPECPPCLTQSIILEIFVFLEVYMTAEDVKFLFEQIDVDGNGTIEEDEWRQFFEKACHRDDLKKRATLKDVYLREVFEVGEMCVDVCSCRRGGRGYEIRKTVYCWFVYVGGMWVLGWGDGKRFDDDLMMNPCPQLTD